MAKGSWCLPTLEDAAGRWPVSWGNLAGAPALLQKTLGLLVFIVSVSLGQTLAVLALYVPCGLWTRAVRRRPLLYVFSCKAKAVTLGLCAALHYTLPKLWL